MSKNRVKLLNIEVDNLSMDEAVNEIDKLVKRKKPSYVVTPNVDHIIKLETDVEFKQIYEDADLILTDGMPLIWISKCKGRPIKEKVSGSDLFPKVCELASHRRYKIFLLGAAEGVALKAAENLEHKYKGIQIAGCYSPKYGFENNKAEIEKIINIVKSAEPDILAVGLGAPKQEKFIHKYLHELNVPVSLAIGASIDFEAGNIKRAPKFMQKSGFEWLYRLIKEPRRLFKRYLVDDIKILSLINKYE